MHDDRTKLLATVIVFATGSLWGFYWLPVRQLTEMGLPGAWGTLAITAAAVVILAPAAIVNWRHIIRSNRVANVSLALGGVAFTLYSVGFVYGRVAIIILLFFLTPVWSTLIGRYVMGWHTPLLRIVAIAIGLAGLAVMLSADGELPLPKSAGEWMGLAAGVLWAMATTGIRTKLELKPLDAAFLFALGAVSAALVIAIFLGTWPDEIPRDNLLPLTALAFAAGGSWWVLSVAGLMWAAVRLEPTRVGILLMMEVIVGAGSAAILAGEHLDRLEIAGGALVLCAGILEVWPTRRVTPSRSTP
ncbi:DMT family transporter [Roseibium polysiphoniae]|uniref:DMT family transporter n=1 Tax=Roseibium polysiphoniae TaxID=2571221 RepID=A0A944GTJ3_9HYPH|nr:DMT family transporter [Roseibium polysiphoniae]MBS8261337.1 DMT family transporter [Roseibium polysiphoniae]